jgi:hypothetical protein
MAAASRTLFSTTALLSTGSTPGMPVQTGRMLVFGGSVHSEVALHEQKILVVVLSWMWVSSPID